MALDGGLRKVFRKHLPHIHWQAIETGMTGGGVPDDNGCYDRHEFWIEYKQTKGYQVKIQPAQVAWHLRRQRAGGRTFLAVLRQGEQLWLFNGADIKHVKLTDINRERHRLLYLGNNGPAKWDWQRIETLLMS